MRIQTCLGLACAAALASTAAADVVFSDTEFQTTNWGIDQLGDIGSMTASQVTGGNPGFCRRIDQTPAALAGSSFYVMHRYGTTMATRYDPVTQGAIASLSFTIDYREAPAAAGNTQQTVFVAAKQGQVVFIGPGINTHGAVGNFQTYSISNLTGASFSAVGTTGSLNLSSTGEPIRFGFATAVTNTSGVWPARVEYDNWSVHIVQVPAPGTAALLGACGLVSFRRRRC